MCAPASVCICARPTGERIFFLLHAIYQQELQHSNTYGERKREISQVCSHQQRRSSSRISFFVFFGNAAADAAQNYKLFQICAQSQVQLISCNVLRPTNLSSTHNPTLSRIDLNFNLCTLTSHLQKNSCTLTVNRPTLLLTSTVVVGLEEFVEHSEVLSFLTTCRVRCCGS